MSFDLVLNLADLDSSTGFILNGITAEDFSGRSVSGVGNVNSEGISDLVIGTWGN